MPQNNTKNNAQDGNVFVIILVAVALFSALMFTFSRSGSQGTSNLTKQEAKIAAQEILNYARLVEGAVDRVRRNGCSESEISFENAVVAGYSNPNSPVDKSCHIFETEGGKISYSTPNEKWLDKNFVGQNSFGSYVYTGSMRIIGVGSTNTELNFYLPYTSKIVCENINSLINISNPPPQDNVGGGVGAFLGVYAPSAIPDIGNDAIELAGKSIFCMQRGTSFNMFIHTLLSR